MKSRDTDFYFVANVTSAWMADLWKIT